MKQKTNTTVAKGQVSPKRTEDQFFFVLYFIKQKNGRKVPAEMLITEKERLGLRDLIESLHGTSAETEDGYFLISL
ncbi:MAG: hypothetical protein CMO55_17010 [Verrucomicrobiales bacterium]|nr:hypothetical protein [Verrucomicrobiales bacterium]